MGLVPTAGGKGEWSQVDICPGLKKKKPGPDPQNPQTLRKVERSTEEMTQKYNVATTHERLVDNLSPTDHKQTMSSEMMELKKICREERRKIP